MKNRPYHTLIAVFIASVLLFSCKKNKDRPADVPESPKPTAGFTFTKVSPDDPFTFKFENSSKDFKEIRWEFGDDSTSTEVSPLHTFAITGDYRIRMISKNDQGYWAQKEVKIKLRADSILDFDSKLGADQKLTLAVSTPIKVAKTEWFLMVNKVSTPVSSNPTAVVSVPAGTFNTYRLKITTPKGSQAELTRLVGNAGILKDVTGAGVLTVSRDNDSGPISKEGSSKLIDNDVNTKFVQFNFKDYLWAQLDYRDAPAVINAYSITSGDDAPERDPKIFRFEASNDRMSWTILDNHLTETFATRKLTKTYIFENTVPYKFYRLYISSTVSAGLIQMSEWRVLQMK